MTAADPQPGDWVKITGKVVELHPNDVDLGVELFSKTDQYVAFVRRDLCKPTGKPIPDEPSVDSVVLVNGEAFQRCLRGWVGIGHARSFSWVSLAGGSSNPVVIHHG